MILDIRVKENVFSSTYLPGDANNFVDANNSTLNVIDAANNHNDSAL